MPRSREFEPGDTLHKAMLLFWQRGYLVVSMDDLVQATGVSRYGFYSTFGDKQALFLKALDHYADTFISRLLGPLETGQAACAEIRWYFATLLEQAESPQAQPGCLIGNAALDGQGQSDALIEERIGHHFARMRRAFGNALQHAVERGELGATFDVEAHAEYLVGIAVGYLAYVRARMPLDALRRFLAVALSRLD
jgi:TetR/AcrR family transcriptional regulator, transcriptional repressor for nem operon